MFEAPSSLIVAKFSQGALLLHQPILRFQHLQSTLLPIIAGMMKATDRPTVSSTLWEALCLRDTVFQASGTRSITGAKQDRPQ